MTILSSHPSTSSTGGASRPTRFRRASTMAATIALSAGVLTAIAAPTAGAATGSSAGSSAPSAPSAPALNSSVSQSGAQKAAIADPGRTAAVATAAGVNPAVVARLLADPEATIAAGERLGVPRDTAVWAANNPEQALGMARAAGINPAWAANILAANL
ncbi:hypothetical protein [Corynebacterium sp.]|uniref:hypothetical protein n=1 Tax=Corynebacterium sp. TaxID=1720 RepID=UPI0028A89168|nr:hypothetical protein [Corynebacterium sp.]